MVLSILRNIKDKDMDAYWILEYGRVFTGYIFLMFIWPTVVFRKHLKNKSRIYHFSFCVTVQIMIVNTIVLGLGLLNFLNRIIYIVLFYGIFFAAAFKIIFSNPNQTKLQQLCGFPTRVRAWVQRLTAGFRAGIIEYDLLLLVVTFGVAYFSFGAFQMHSYGCYDVFTHHGWVSEMVDGTIFPDGIYPAAMHSFIYCLNALFDIRVYNIMLFLQCIHIITFLLSVYCLLREVFTWRFSPVFAIALFLTINLNNYHGMYRLPVTLPMEFGLHTQFLCALFLIRYLKSTDRIIIRGRSSRCFWSVDLLVFAMALSASISAHYYVTIMAFIVCASFALFHLKKLLNSQYLIPLIFAVVCGCLIAMAPVAGALASGIPFQDSIRWGINMINSSKGDDKKSDNVGSSASAPAETSTTIGVLSPSAEDLEMIDKLPETAQKIVKNMIAVEKLVRITYKYGYQGTFKQERGTRIFRITVAVIMLCIVCRLFAWKRLNKITRMYFPVILISFISMLIYAAYASRELGLMVIIPNHRFCPEGFLMVFAVMMMPADILFSLGAGYCKDRIMQVLSCIFTFSIYVYMNKHGIFHEYLYYSLMRYDAAALVTNSIIDEFEQATYTIVSPKEEHHQVELYGEHVEISDFLENCMEDEYFLPTEYVFIYVEKRPFVYYQDYYFKGPEWLAKSRDFIPETSVISKEAAQQELSGYENGSWNLYMYDRTILESKAYEWCQQFSKRYPSKLDVYYEDENFICYYFKQDMEERYNLTGGESEQSMYGGSK